MVSIFLWRSGPLGDLRWMYTPTAIIVAQIIIAVPVVTGLTVSSLQQLDPRLNFSVIGIGCFPDTICNYVMAGKHAFLY